MVKQFFCIFLGIAIGGSAFGQSNTSTKKVYIDLNTGFTFSQNAFTNTWEASPAPHLNIRIPFYAGQMEGGMRITRFKGYAPSQTDSDFTSVYMYVGYSYPFKITSWYHIAPGIRFGNNLMIFDKAEVYTNYKGNYRFVTDDNESEFAYELMLRNQFQITSHWSLHAELSYNRTFTYYPLEVALFSIGVSYSFQQPNWLKDFIQ